MFIGFISFSVKSFSHSDMYFSSNHSNVHFNYVIGWSELEYKNRIKILEDLVIKLVKKKEYKGRIYFQFFHDYTYYESNYFAIGYDKFSYFDSIGIERFGTGITFIISHRELEIGKILNAVNSALDNVSYIKSTQKPLNFRTRHKGETGFDLSIPSNMVIKYQANRSKLIDSLLNQKTYRNLKKLDMEYNNGEIDYYFKNNKFHFYDTKRPKEEWSDIKGEWIPMEIGNDILIVNNVYEIVGEFRSGHLVFTTDSTFFYIFPEKDRVTGPFVLDSVRTRTPILDFLFDHRPLNRISLFYEASGFRNKSNYTNRKILFIPDSSLIINEFDKAEADFIFKLINKQNLNNPETDISCFVIILSTLLFISLMFSFWLILKLKKNKQAPL